jgi:hypothetical protein
MFQPLFIFHKGDSLIAKVIRKFSKFSHVALQIDIIHTLETNYKTPISIEHFAYEKGTYDVYEFYRPLTDEEIQIIHQFIFSNLNKKYDWIFIFSRLGNILFNTKIKSTPNRYTCDELIYASFKQIGYDLVDGKLTPETLSKSKYLRKVN